MKKWFPPKFLKSVAGLWVGYAAATVTCMVSLQLHLHAELQEPQPLAAPPTKKSPLRKPEDPRIPVHNPLFQVKKAEGNATLARLIQKIKEDIFNRSDSEYLTFNDFQEFLDRVKQARGLQVPTRSSRPKHIREEPACNKRRKHLIRETCAAGLPHIKPARKWTTNDAKKYASQLSNVIVDDRHKLLFCDIPKVGSTSWKVTIALLTGQVLKRDILHKNYLAVHSPYYMAQLGLYTLNSAHPKLIRKKLKRYYKFLVVRHPLDRLVSAYTDKFLNQDGYKDWYENMKIIIKARYRDDDADQNATITFREFLNYAADSDSIRDRHWLSYQYLCGPCVIDYDYVVKVESLEQDVSYLMPKVFNEYGVSALPEAHSHRSASHARKGYKELREFFNVTKQEALRLMDGPYQWDLPMFGYRFDAETGRATCDNYTEDGQCC